MPRFSQANKLSCQKTQGCRLMMSWYIDVIQILLLQSKDFSKNEHKFLGGWIDRYLLESADNAVLTSTLLQVFKKCNQLSSSENGNFNYLTDIFIYRKSKILYILRKLTLFI